MKAPDKIYVASYNGEAFSHSWTMEPLGDTTATEYIRKDALLEWAKKKYDSAFRLHLKKGDKYHYGLGKMDAYKILIEKIQSL